MRHLLTAFLLSAGILGLAGRIVISYFSIGTNDATAWLMFAERITGTGLTDLYRTHEPFNHPPLMGLWSYLALKLTYHFPLHFFFMFRLPGIIMDVLVALGLYSIWETRKGKTYGALAFACYGLSLISILISGYHGNTDPLYAGLVFFSLCAFSRNRFFLSGTLLGCAVNIKIIPCLFILPLLAIIPDWKNRIKFIAGGSIWTIPFIAAGIITGPAFVRNVFGYDSFVDYWGIQLFLLLFASNSPEYRSLFLTLSEYYSSIGRYLIIGCFVLLSVWLVKHSKNQVNPFKVIAIFVAIFAIIAPGFAGQYFVLFPPLILAFSLSWGLSIATLTGLLTGVSYHSFLVSYFPLASVHNQTAPNQLVVLVSFLAWTLILWFLIEISLHLYGEFKQRK